MLTEMPSAQQQQPDLQSKTSGDQNPSVSSRVSFAVDASSAGRTGTGDGMDPSTGGVGIGRHTSGVHGAASLRVLRSMNVAAVTGAAPHAADASVRPNGAAAGVDTAAADTSVRSAAGTVPPGVYNGLGGVGVHGWKDSGAAAGADPRLPEPRAALANKIKVSEALVLRSQCRCGRVCVVLSDELQQSRVLCVEQRKVCVTCHVWPAGVPGPAGGHAHVRTHD